LAEDVAPSALDRPPWLIGASVYHQGRRVADTGLDEAGEWSRRP